MRPRRSIPSSCVTERIYDSRPGLVTVMLTCLPFLDQSDEGILISVGRYTIANPA
jgi:hypothetical protein